MVSVASSGTTDRIAARTLFNVPRAGGGTRARYSSTLLAVVCGFLEDAFFIDLHFIGSTTQAGLLAMDARNGCHREQPGGERLTRSSAYCTSGAVTRGFTSTL